MDRKQAFVVLGLPDTATRDEIARRYDVLERKNRILQQQAEGTPTTLEIEVAYKLLAGIAWKDPVAENRLRQRDEHPGLIARMLRMEQTKLDNLVHYYRKPVLIIAVVLGVVAWFIISTVFRTPDDFRMLVAGDIYMQNQDKLQAAVLKDMPGTLNPMLQNIYLGKTTDPQMQAAVSQKLIVEIGYGENDILVLDRFLYEQYAAQGAFQPLDAILGDYGTSLKEQEKQRIAILPDVLAAGEDGNPHVYGIDVTGSSFLKDAEVLGLDMVAVFGLKSKFPDKGRMMMQLLMKK